jgi:hypothetical protein
VKPRREALPLGGNGTTDSHRATKGELFGGGVCWRVWVKILRCVAGSTETTPRPLQLASAGLFPLNHASWATLTYTMVEVTVPPIDSFTAASKSP